MSLATPTALSQQVDQLSDQLLSDLQALMRIASVEGEPMPNAPFGKENREALDFVLNRTREWGWKTADIDGYVGWAEFGSGEKLITALCHLDVVPVGPGWKFGPWSATIDQGYLYGRGAVDDKGPTIAALYAARALHLVNPEPGARIRIVFGCNEESGFKCIERYAETEELPTMGFAPDAGWPLYHAEKGIANLEVRVKPFGGDYQWQHLEGGTRTNIVIDSATGGLKVGSASRGEVKEKLAKLWDKNVDAKLEGEVLTIEATGKAAHGSWPHGGDNAAMRILRTWMDLAPASARRSYEELFEMTHIGGDGLGIHGNDDISELTCNLGIVRTVGNELVLTFNIRYPVTWKGETLVERCKAYLAELEIQAEVQMIENSKPLYFPLEHPLVETVIQAYEEETGEKRKPGVMGGGTYARSIPNCVAIGTGWAGDGEAHQTDERIKVVHLAKMSRIYARILQNLAAK